MNGSSSLEEQQRILLQQSALRRQAASISLPTDPDTINLWFRELHEPIILFGESLVDRRTRLGVEVAKRGGLEALPRLKATLKKQPSETVKIDTVPGRTSGGEHLKVLRRELTEFWYAHRHRHEQEGTNNTTHQEPKLSYTIDLEAASMIDGRPSTSICALTDYFAVSDRDGLVTLLDEMSLTAQYSVKLDTMGCSHLASHENQVSASCQDGKIIVYSHDTKTTLVKKQPGGGRVSMTCWHPSGQYLVSASSQGSWSFWSVDVSQDNPLFSLHGHHPALGVKSCVIERQAGALIGTGGGDGVMRVWDVRVGKCIFTANEHVQAITAMECAKGSLFMTGGMDNRIAVWDLRHVKSPMSLIPAHTNSITGICMVTESSFASCSLDGHVKVWDCSNGRPLASYHVDDASKLTSVCRSHNHHHHHLYSCGFDRLVRQFSVTNTIVLNINVL